MKAADELMNDATSISATAVNKQTVNVATMMLDTAMTKQCKAWRKIGQKRKLADKLHKLLEKAMSATANAAKERAKLRLSNLLKERIQYSVGLPCC